MNRRQVLTRVVGPMARVLVRRAARQTSDLESLKAKLAEGLPQEVINDPASNFNTLRLRTATDFFKFEYAYVVENLSRDEQKNLEDSTFKN